jgi:hypothetical protein
MLAWCAKWSRLHLKRSGMSGGGTIDSLRPDDERSTQRFIGSKG